MSLTNVTSITHLVCLFRKSSCLPVQNSNEKDLDLNVNPFLGNGDMAFALECILEKKVLGHSDLAIRVSFTHVVDRLFKYQKWAGVCNGSIIDVIY